MKNSGVLPVQIPGRGLPATQGARSVALPRPPSREIRSNIGLAAEQFIRDWQHSEASLQNRLRNLPAQSRGLLEMQLAASSLHRKADLMGRAA